MSEEFLEQFAVAHDVITSMQLKELKSLQEKTRASFESVLQETGIFRIDDLYWMVAASFGLSYFEEFNVDMVDVELNSQLPMDFLESHQILLIGDRKGVLQVGISHPKAIQEKEQLKVRFQSGIEFVLIRRTLLLEALNKVRTGHQRSMDDLLEDLESVSDDYSDQDETEYLMDIANKAPIVRLVNMIILQAINEQVSDVHFEPYEKSLEVRFRLDGVLRTIQSSPKSLTQAVTSRIKLLAHMDITEKRLPQDGKFKMRIQDKEFDIRVSTLPSYFGESVVLRILNNAGEKMSLNGTGLEGGNYERVMDMMHHSSGIVLVTGPTGSGKTSTLYGIFGEFNRTEKKLITVEDPVEYQMHGVVQIAVNPRIGLTFASALRNILRQDPDIILVGEIRDFETAEMAVQASLTGHLVFSTLHTNDAPSAVIRLMDMGVEPYLITASVIGVIAQRLVRKLCDDCKKSFLPDELVMGSTQSSYSRSCEPVGCEKCNHVGYKGRIGIFEVLTFDEKFREVILQGASPVALHESAQKQGMITMKKDGFEKVRRGVTTLEEVFKVV